MPVIDLGYRSWEGPRSSRLLRPLAITQTGLQLVWRTAWLRRLLLFAWLPIIPVAIGFFLYEQSITDQESQAVLAQVMRTALNRPDIAALIQANPTEARHEVWGQLLFAFFRYPQAINMVLLFGLVAPRIISYDLRSRAYLLYFSRPLTVFEYLAGKAMILGILLLLTTTLPALLVYLFGLLLSPDTTAITQTWDFVIRILFASLAFVLPTASLAILLSSFTSDSRYASFMWFAIWILGWVTYGVLNSSALVNNAASPIMLTGTPQTRLVSLYHTLGDVQSVIFGALQDPSDAYAAISLTAVITVAAIMVAYHRVSSQLRL